MSVYRARWVDPSTGKPRVRYFHARREAAEFAKMPRETAVDIKRMSEVQP